MMLSGTDLHVWTVPCMQDHVCRVDVSCDIHTQIIATYCPYRQEVLGWVSLSGLPELCGYIMYVIDCVWLFQHYN